MKKNKIIYWISTVLLCLPMLGAGYAYFFNPEIVQAFKHFGFPDYFRVELGVAKVLGALALLIPIVPARIKEWAYAGFFITLVSASITHYSIGDEIGEIIPPIIMLVISIVSYVFYHKIHSIDVVKNT